MLCQRVLGFQFKIWDVVHFPVFVMHFKFLREFWRIGGGVRVEGILFFSIVEEIFLSLFVLVDDILWTHAIYITRWRTVTATFISTDFSVNFIFFSSFIIRDQPSFWSFIYKSHVFGWEVKSFVSILNSLLYFSNISLLSFGEHPFKTRFFRCLVVWSGFSVFSISIILVFFSLWLKVKLMLSFFY